MQCWNPATSSCAHDDPAHPTWRCLGLTGRKAAPETSMHARFRESFLGCKTRHRFLTVRQIQKSLTYICSICLGSLVLQEPQTLARSSALQPESAITQVKRFRIIGSAMLR